MGICTSCHSTSPATGKLVLPDGRLQEFFHPTKISDVLHMNPNTFICNSDEMDFDDVVFPMKDHEDLQPGQLYFALPLKRLNRPFQPEEMAALAVKASAALAAKCGGCRRHRSENICFTTSFSGEKRRVRSSCRVADGETIGLSRRSCGGGGEKGRRLKAMLSAIPE